MEVKFGSLFKVPNNYSHFNSTQLDLYILCPNDDMNQTRLKFNWNLINFTNSLMTFNLSFDDP